MISYDDVFALPIFKYTLDEDFPIPPSIELPSHDELPVSKLEWLYV